MNSCYSLQEFMNSIPVRCSRKYVNRLNRSYAKLFTAQILDFNFVFQKKMQRRHDFHWNWLPKAQKRSARSSSRHSNIAKSVSNNQSLFKSSICRKYFSVYRLENQDRSTSFWTMELRTLARSSKLHRPSASGHYSSLSQSPNAARFSFGPFKPDPRTTTVGVSGLYY